jgi:hypothetical protein
VALSGRSCTTSLVCVCELVCGWQTLKQGKGGGKELLLVGLLGRDATRKKDVHRVRWNLLVFMFYFDVKEEVDTVVRTSWFL